MPSFLVLITSFAERGVRMSEPTFDIFRGAIGSGEEVWLEAVSGLLRAYLRMEQIATAKPGLYFLFNVQAHVVVGSADTRDLTLPSSARKPRVA
jgi:hypothetical protein